MDYTPKHTQPFTFAQACELEIPTVTKEISRLENSLYHLRRTQAELKEHLSGSTEEDSELLGVMSENEGVIASQTERISMLKLALEEQGINTRSGHYDSVKDPGVEAPAPQPQSGPTGGNQADQVVQEERDDGVYL